MSGLPAGIFIEEAIIAKTMVRLPGTQLLRPVQSDSVPAGKVVRGDCNWRLGLQASLDGELAGNEMRPLAAELAGKKEARLLLAELAMIKSTLAKSEIERHVPQTRAAYWSKIERTITRTERQQTR